MVVRYQPKVNLRSRELVGVEASAARLGADAATPGVAGAFGAVGAAALGHMGVVRTLLTVGLIPVGIIGARELAMVKPGVRIINAARGGIIDEDALARMRENPLRLFDTKDPRVAEVMRVVASAWPIYLVSAAALSQLAVAELVLPALDPRRESA